MKKLLFCIISLILTISIIYSRSIDQFVDSKLIKPDIAIFNEKFTITIQHSARKEISNTYLEIITYKNPFLISDSIQEIGEVKEEFTINNSISFIIPKTKPNKIYRTTAILHYKIKNIEYLKTTDIYFLINKNFIEIYNQQEFSSQKDYFWKVNSLDNIPETKNLKDIISSGIPIKSQPGFKEKNRNILFNSNDLKMRFKKNEAQKPNTDRNDTNRTTVNVSGTVFFLNSINEYIPFRNGTIQIWEEDLAIHDHIGTTLTNNDGYFSIEVTASDFLSDEIEIFLQIIAGNNKITVYDPISALPYMWPTGFYIQTSGSDINFGALSIELGGYGACSIFHWMNLGWSFSVSSGFDPGLIEGVWPWDVYGTSYFNNDTEAIYLTSDAWSWDAEDVTLHEYGHALMYKAQNSWWPDNTGGSHNFYDILHENMAWTEGWATAFAQFVKPDGFYNAQWGNFNIESQIGYTTLPEGYQNEARVAAAMNDLYDYSEDGEDHVSITYSKIINTLINNNNNHLINFWDNLLPDLTNEEQYVASDAMIYNTIEIDPIIEPDPLTVLINGPTYLTPGSSGTFTAVPSGGSEQYVNYRWRRKSF